MREERSALRRLGLAFLALLTGTYCLVAYAALAALPSNPLRLPWKDAVGAVRWIPQGWSFFTRDPREEQLSLFVRDETGRWRDGALGPVSHPRNAFGLDRRVRAQGVEAAFLIASAAPGAWMSFEAPDVGPDPARHLEGLPIAAATKTRSPAPSLTGVVALVKREPVPWAWFSAGREVAMPFKVLVVEVE